MAVRATIGGGAQVGTLSFNDIIGHTPGRAGRTDAQKGMFQHIRTGNVLVVYSKNPQFVECAPRANGRRTTRTGFTRTGMFIISKRTGEARLVVANRDPDGAKEWVPFTGSITLQGNPHVVPDPVAAGNAPTDDYDDEGDE